MGPELCANGPPVAGASAAWTSAVEALLALGHDGPVVLPGAEPHPRYRHPDSPAGVEFRPATTATEIDLRRRTATFRDTTGATESLRYNSLVLATGGIALTGVLTEDIALHGGPRINAENAVIALAEQGVRASVVRLPPAVHSGYPEPAWWTSLSASVRSITAAVHAPRQHRRSRTDRTVSRSPSCRHARQHWDRQQAVRIPSAVPRERSAPARPAFLAWSRMSPDDGQGGLMGDQIWTVTADFARCEGHGLCVEEAPSHLRMDEDLVAITEDTVTDGHLPALRAAVRACPVAALRLEQRATS
ncbi:ferredoxin [Amycolatopsis acidicola]|nr:ferredoxin [Amycolatopsis acidicola]